MALRLERERNRSGAKIVLLCGGEADCGVTWLARNLAEALTQYVDRVLIVRLDPNRDSSRTYHQPSYSFERYFEEAWARISVNRDHVTQLGVGPETPLLHRRDWLREFLNRLKPDYGLILVDARPVAESDLTRYVAGFTDVAVMVAGQGKTRYRQFRKGVELLVRLGTPAITGVLVGKTEQPLDQLMMAIRLLMEVEVPRLARAGLGAINQRIVGLQSAISLRMERYRVGRGES
jgi:hypothetical protein